MTSERPNNCRNALRDAGKPYPKSGCAVCKDGGLRGCPYERPRDEKPMTSERELEALASASTVLDNAATLIDALSPGDVAAENCRGHANNLRVIARRLQPARVPEAKEQTGFREDGPEKFGYVRGWNACREALLAAAPAAEGGKPVAWRIHWSESDFAKPELTDDAQRVAKVAALENPPKIVLLGVIATPAPESREYGLRDAYEGARSDLLDWKGRAQRAEAELRRLGYVGIDASEKPEAGQREGVEMLADIDHAISVWAGRMSAREWRMQWPEASQMHSELVEKRRSIARRLASAQQDGNRPATGTVADISDEELLRRAVTTVAKQKKRQPTWAKIMDVFMLGSTYSAQLCRRFDIDPDTGKTTQRTVSPADDATPIDPKEEHF